MLSTEVPACQLRPPELPELVTAGRELKVIWLQSGSKTLDCSFSQILVGKELALAIDGKLKKVMQMKAKIRQSVLAAIKAEPIWLDFFNGLGLFMEILLMLTKIAKKKATLFFLS
jgi:hypothetical protein